MKYSECEKVRASRDEKLTIEEFLDWAQKRGIELCTPMPGGGGRFYPMSRTREMVLMDYFEIDLKKLEEERRAILEEQRKLNERGP
jgi:hypothetical protein